MVDVYDVTNVRQIERSNSLTLRVHRSAMHPCSARPTAVFALTWLTFMTSPMSAKSSDPPTLHVHRSADRRIHVTMVVVHDVTNGQYSVIGATKIFQVQKRAN